MKRIFTFTPVAFHANAIFWQRDTGLISRCLRSVGCDSKCIMPLPWHEDDVDREHIMRATMEDLKSAAWWKSLHLDGIVLYTWADPHYSSIVKAVKRAGVRSMLHMDRGTTLFRPYAPDKNLFVNAYFRVKDAVLNCLRSRQMMMADVVSASQPLVDVHLKCPCFSPRLKEKFRIFPCPVAPTFIYSGEPKEERVVCVGRWSDEEIDVVKRPEYLRAVAERFVEIDTCAVFEIYGRCGQGMTDWYAGLPEEKKQRIRLMGRVPNETLPAVYQRSMVSLCPSRSEGTHIASTEALNCGATIVTSCRPSLSVLHWYISMGGGSISEEDTPESFALAIEHELEQWRQGKRDAHRIAAAFNDMFHVDKALARIFDLT